MEPAPIRLRINGWPATVLTWSDAEFAALAEPPADAQRDRHGVWVAVRFDD